MPDAEMGISIEHQKETMERYAGYKLHGVPFGAWWPDPAQSASVPLGQRPGGSRMLLNLASGDHVLFAKLDRGFRNAGDLCAMLDHWDARAIHFHLLDMDVDSRTDTGRLFIRIAACFAQFERERISARVKDAIATRKRLGYAHSQPPYGFKNVGPRGKRRLAPNPHQRQIGRAIIEWHRKGYTYGEIGKHLTAQKIPWKKGKPFVIEHPSSVYRWHVAELQLQLAEATGAAPAGRPGEAP